MILENRVLQIYDKINFEERYFELLQNHSHKDYLEKPKKENVLETLKKLGYSAKFFSKEGFYQVEKITIGNYDFYFNCGLKYGVCELIFGAKNIETNAKIGGVVTRIFKLIKRAKGEDIISPIKDLSFSSYEELESILKEALVLYEDLKAEVLKQVESN